MNAMLAVILALASLGFLLLGRLLFSPRARVTSPESAAMPLTVIIPARNEEENLPALLESIQAQQLPDIEIIVVDDASTDATAARARQLNAVVLPAPALPAGWRGKTWACFNGAKAAAHPTLLFLDADTRIEADGLAAILRQFSRQPTVLSVLPYHIVKRPYEQLSAFFNLLMAAGSGAFTFPPVPTAGLFGQMLLIDKALYFSVGGHEVVKAEILENFHFARFFREKGIPFRCVAGARRLSMRMYAHGLPDLVDGWTKAFAAGAAQTPLALLLAIIAWLSGLLMAAMMLVHSPGVSTLAVYGVAVVQLALLLRRVGSFPFYVALLYPIPLCAYFLLFARALTRRRVVWKGRTIDAAG